MENYEYIPPQVNRTNASRASIKKLKRKNRRKNIWICILIFIILLLIAAFGIAYARYYKQTYKEPSMEYISMTEEASARAYVWLSKIEDTDLSYEDVKDCMGSFNLEVVKKPTDVKGEYTYELEESSYDQCLNQAKTGLEKAYKMAVLRRVSAEGYTENLSDGLVEQLMSETFGMSVSQYLNECNIKLLPEKDEINVNSLLKADLTEEQNEKN